MKMWHSEDDGSIRHDSGRFFSIVGIDVNTTMEISVIGVSNHTSARSWDILVY